MTSESDAPDNDRAGLSDADLVWNRAALEAGGNSPGEGDAALAALLAFHSIAMNGGVLHSAEIHSEDAIASALAGYRYFGLREAADAIEWTLVMLRDGDLDADDDLADRVEMEADERYSAAVPSDSVLSDAFEAFRRENPTAFAPV